MSTAAALRKQMRALRRALPVAERHTCARQLAGRVTSLKVFSHAHHIAAYLAVDSEMDPAPLLERAWELGKQVYLPVLAGTPAVHLLFATYRRHSAMQANRFGILEPVVPAGELLPPQRLDLVLTPLVAFDASGTRLGMGGGFYDRSFAFRGNPAHLPRPLLLGLAYELQKVAELPRQDWDIPLDGIVTEQAVYSVPGGHLLE
jgi:5-formyltetrahydrofolate cyclo-ligase